MATSLATASTSLAAGSIAGPVADPLAGAVPIVADKPAPIKRKRFSARIPPNKVKKVLQSDEEIGRVQGSVPAVLGRAMEHFAENLLKQTAKVTNSSAGRTVTPGHMKTAICNETQFQFLEDVVKCVPHPSTHNSHEQKTKAKKKRKVEDDVDYDTD